MRSNPFRPISHTASEIIAERIVARLYKLPPTLSKRKKAPTESRNRGGFRLRPAVIGDQAANSVNARSEPRFREAGGHEEV
jgi:hypothetical protein